MWRKFFIFLGVESVLAVGFASCFAIGLRMDSMYVVYHTKDSPDGKFKAVAHYSDSGATSSLYTTVSIVPAGFETPKETREPPDYPNSIFVGSIPGRQIRFRWTGPRTLSIRYPKGENVSDFEQTVQVDQETFTVQTAEYTSATSN